MKKILIMLSTYNGEKYLREQLDSLYAQEGVDIHILVRDDGSKDDTINILNEYQSRSGRMSVLAESNVGAAMSFFKLIETAATDYHDFDYYAFSDQDDVWMSNKLKDAAETLDKSNASIKLYYCQSETVDAQLNPLKQNNGKVVNNLKGNIVSSHILGCTQVFNANLLKLISEYHPNSQTRVLLHDGWTALVAYSFDADVIVDAISHIKYRQHGNNVVGSGMSFLQRQRKRIGRYISGTPLKSYKCQLVLDVFDGKLKPENKAVLEMCCSYRHNLRNKMKMLFDSGFYQYDLTTNIGVFLMILFNRF